MSAVPCERLRPHLERAVQQWGGVERFADNHEHLGVHSRMVWTVLSGERETVTMSTADKLVTAIDPMLWYSELSEFAPIAMGKARRSQGWKRNGKMDKEQVLSAHRLHRKGFSLREMGRMLWDQCGYASPTHCADALGKRFKYHGLPVNPPGRFPEFGLTTDQIRKARMLYENGMSVELISKRHYEKWGFRSPATLNRKLYDALRSLGILRTHGEALSVAWAQGRRGSRDKSRDREIAQLYLSGSSMRAIAREHGQRWGYRSFYSALSHVRLVLDRSGIPRRPRTQVNRQCWDVRRESEEAA